MSATGRAIRIVSGPRYRLVATFAGGEEATRGEFESIPAAQSQVGAFVCDLAERGRPVSIRIERFAQATGSNGKTRHEPPTGGETLRRWDETVIDRILGQRSARLGAESRSDSHREMSVPAEVAESPPPAVESPNGHATKPLECETAASALHARETAPGADPCDEARKIVAQSADDESVAATAIEVRQIPEESEPAPDRGETVTVVSGVAAQLASPVPAPAPATAGAHSHARYRPHHRRTRWVLILTAAFIAILFGGMILIETNGDPIGYLRKLASGEKVRETLPFRNGEGSASKPAGRK